MISLLLPPDQPCRLTGGEQEVTLPQQSGHLWSIEAVLHSQRQEQSKEETVVAEEEVAKKLENETMLLRSES